MCYEFVFVSFFAALYLVTTFMLNTIERIKAMKLKDKVTVKIDALRKELHKYNELCKEFFKKK